jgi:hypothetical protein
MKLVQHRIPVLALLVIAVTTGAGVQNRALTLDPTSGPPGARVTVVGGLGAECATAQSVSVRFDGSVIASGLTFTVPVQAPPGGHEVAVTCQFFGSGDSATLDGQASLTVLSTVTNPPTSDPTPSPDVVVPPVSTTATAGVDPATRGPARPDSADPRPAADWESDPTPWLAGLIGLAFAGLALLIRHLTRSRSDRNGQPPAEISVVPVAGPVSGPTLQSREEAPGIDVRVVLRPDPGESTLSDR